MKKIGIIPSERIAVEIDEIDQLSRMLTSMRRRMRENMLEEMRLDGRRIPSRYHIRRYLHPKKDGDASAPPSNISSL